MKTFLRLVLLMGLIFGSGDICLADSPDDLQLLEKLNLLTNSSFEEGRNGQSQGWLFNAGAEPPDNRRMRFIYSGEQAHTGRKSLATIVGGSRSDAKMRTAYSIILEPGKSYLLKGWYNVAAGSDKKKNQKTPKIFASIVGKPVDYDYSKGTVTTHLDMTKQPKGKICFRVKPEFERSGRTGWQPFELFFAMPAGKIPYWVQVHLSVQGARANRTWFDDIYLVPAPAFRVVEPEMPIICEQDNVFSIKLAVTDQHCKPVSSVDKWQAHAGALPLKIKRTRYLAAEALWQLDIIAPKQRAFSNLRIKASVSGRKKECVKDKFLYTIPETKDTFSFVGIGDPCVYEHRLEKDSLIRKAQKTINVLGPTFVLSLGDIFGWTPFWGDAGYFYGVDYYREYIAGFNMPVYSVAGNHDLDPGFTIERTRYYYRRYLGIPYYYSFDVGSYHFVGMDSSIASSAGRRAHGGDFDVPGQLEWLEKDLSKTKAQGSKPVVFFHHPIYMEFARSPERAKALALFFKYGTSLVLNGHWHGTWIRAKKNPYYKGKTELQEVTLKGSYASADLDPSYRNNPAFTLFEVAPNFSGFLREPEVNYRGYRYIWVKEGKIAYDDVLSDAIEIQVIESGETRKTLEIRNPYKKEKNIKYQVSADRDFNNVPIKVTMKPGYDYKAYLERTGKPLPIYQVPKSDIVECWVQVDLKRDSSVTVVVEKNDKVFKDM